MLVEDGHLNGVGGLVHVEGLGAHDARATYGQHPVGGEEGRLDQEAGGLTGLVLLLLGDEGDVLLLDAARGWALAAGLPHADVGAVGAALGVGQGGADAVAAAHLRLEGAGLRLVGRRDLAFLRVHLELLVAAVAPLPGDSGQAQGHIGAGHDVAVEVHDQRLDLDGVVLVHVAALGAQAHVQVGGVDHDRGRGGPGLAVDVGDGGLGPHVHRPRGVHGLEVDAQVVLAQRVGLALEVLPGVVAAAAAAVPPPGAPRPELVVGAVGGLVARGGGVDVPLDRGVGQAAAGVVGGVHADRGLVAQHEGAGLGGRADLELGPAELLDLDGVVVAGADHVASVLGLQGEPGGAEVDVPGQLQGHVEAAEGRDLHVAAGQVVAARAAQAPLDARRQGLESLDVAALAGLQAPHPALDPHLLAGLVQAAVVERVPAHLVVLLDLAPARVVVPPAGGLGQHGQVVAQGRHEHLGSRRVLGELGAGQAVAIGRAHRGLVGDDLQLGALDARAVGELGDPGHDLLVVGERGQAHLGDLDPREDLLAAPAILGLLGRLDPQQELAGPTLQVRAQVDGGLVEGVLLTLDLDLGVQDLHAGHGAGLVRVVVVRAPPVAPRAPQGRIDAVDAHLDLVVVGGEHREARRPGRVEGDHLLAGPEQGLLGRPHLELQCLGLAEGLAELVGQRRGQGHGVGGAPGLDAGEGQRRAGLLDQQAGHGRLDADLRGVEGGLVQRVVELDVPRRRGRAVVVPRAVVVGDLERIVGLEGLELVRRGGARALGGRRATLDRDGDRRGLGQHRLRLERDPAPLLGPLDQGRDHGIRRDLFLGGLAQADGLAAAAGGQLHVLDQGLRVDALVEAQEHHRLEGMGTVLGVDRAQAQRRGGEGEVRCIGQGVTVGRLGAGGHLDGVLGGHGEPRVGLEHQGAGAEPAPVALGLRRQLHRHGLRRLGLGGHRHHGLVEGQAQVRGQVDLTLGGVAQDGQDTGLARVHDGGALDRRERHVDGLAGQRWRQGTLAQGECHPVAGLHLQRGDPGQDLVRPRRRQLLARGHGQGRGLGRRGAHLAQAHAQPGDVLVHHVAHGAR